MVLRFLGHLLLMKLGRVPSKYKTCQEILLDLGASDEVPPQNGKEELDSFLVESFSIGWREAPQVFDGYEAWVTLIGGGQKQTPLNVWVDQRLPQGHLDVSSDPQTGLSFTHLFLGNEPLKIQAQKGGTAVAYHSLDGRQRLQETVVEILIRHLHRPIGMRCWKTLHSAGREHAPIFRELGSRQTRCCGRGRCGISV